MTVNLKPRNSTWLQKADLTFVVRQTQRMLFVLVSSMHALFELCFLLVLIRFLICLKLKNFSYLRTTPSLVAKEINETGRGQAGKPVDFGLCQTN